MSSYLQQVVLLKSVLMVCSYRAQLNEICTYGRVSRGSLLRVRRYGLLYYGQSNTTIMTNFTFKCCDCSQRKIKIGYCLLCILFILYIYISSFAWQTYVMLIIQLVITITIRVCPLSIDVQPWLIIVVQHANLWHVVCCAIPYHGPKLAR